MITTRCTGYTSTTERGQRTRGCTEITLIFPCRLQLEVPTSLSMTMHFESNSASSKSFVKDSRVDLSERDGLWETCFGWNSYLKILKGFHLHCTIGSFLSFFSRLGSLVPELTWITVSVHPAHIPHMNQTPRPVSVNIPTENIQVILYENVGGWVSFFCLFFIFFCRSWLRH